MYGGCFKMNILCKVLSRYMLGDIWENHDQCEDSGGDPM